MAKQKKTEGTDPIYEPFVRTDATNINIQHKPLPENVRKHQALPDGLVSFNEDMHQGYADKFIDRLDEWVNHPETREYGALVDLRELGQLSGANINYDMLSKNYNFKDNPMDLGGFKRLPESRINRVRKYTTDGVIERTSSGDYDIINDSKLPNVSKERETELKKWLLDWWSNPETLERMTKVMDGHYSAKFAVKKIKNNINTVKIKDSADMMKIGNVYIPAAAAYYMPRYHHVVGLLSHGPEVMVHEITHGSKVASYPEVRNAIYEALKGDSHNKERSRYMRSSGEVYSRIMQIRHDAGIKPGQIITPESYDKLMTPKVKRDEDLFKNYDKKTIINFLNTLASNDSKPKETPRTRIARKGGVLYRKYQVGGVASTREFDTRYKFQKHVDSIPELVGALYGPLTGRVSSIPTSMVSSILRLVTGRAKGTVTNNITDRQRDILIRSKAFSNIGTDAALAFIGGSGGSALKAVDDGITVFSKYDPTIHITEIDMPDYDTIQILKKQEERRRKKNEERQKKKNEEQQDKEKNKQQNE